MSAPRQRRHSTVRQLMHGWTLYMVLGMLAMILHGWVAAIHAIRGDGASMAAPDPAASKKIEPLSATEPMREPGLTASTWIMTGYFTVMWLAGLALTYRVLRRNDWQWLWRSQSRRLAVWSWADVARLVLFIFFVASLLPFVRLVLLPFRPEWLEDTHLWTVVSMLALDVIAILAAVVLSSTKQRSGWVSLGLIRRRRLWPAVVTGFQGYLLCFPWIFLLLMLVMGMTRQFGLNPPLPPIHDLVMRESRPLMLGLTMLLACIIGPLAEEVFFRGVLYPALRRRASRVVAVMTTGAIFSLVHTNVVGFLPIMALGCLLAVVYERTGSLISPLFVHAMHNTLLMALAMIFRGSAMP